MCILKEQSKPEEVFFIVKGSVINLLTERVFSVGNIIGESDFVYRRERVESFVTVDDVYAVKFEGWIFQEIMEQFPEVRRDVEYIAREREKARADKIQEKHRKMRNDKIEGKGKKEGKRGRYTSIGKVKKSSEMS